MEHGNFRARETILCDTITVDVCLYAFVETHRMYNRANPNVNCGLGLIIMYLH